MNDINNVNLVGRLTRDVEVTYLSGGTAVGNFSLAVNRSKKTADGYVDEASYFDCVAFGKLIESLKPYMTKGKQIAVQGFLRQERWESNNGEKRSRITVGVSDIQLLGGGSSQSSSQQTSYNNSYTRPQQQFAQEQQQEFQEDIPF